MQILQMYEKALATNQRLKSRLETSKQELVVIQEQLQRAQVTSTWLQLVCPSSDILYCKLRV